MFRLLLLVLLFAYTNLSTAQSFIQGRVLDAETKEPLAFVTIVIDQGNQGISTDIDGKFNLKTKQEITQLTFTYIGYEKKVMSSSQLKENQNTILLKRSTYQLKEVVILPGENPAHRIIQLAVANKKINNPEKATTFSYESYNKLIFTGDLDSTILANKDSLNALDSNSREAYDFVSNQHFFLMESVSERNHIPPTHSKEVVKASRVSGLKNPTFTLIGTQLQSFSLYTTYIQLFGSSYLSPISQGSINKYLFVLEDTLFQGNDTVYTISFRPRKGKYFDGLEGVLSINTNLYAVQNFIARTIAEEDISVKIQQKYEFIENKQWFPVQLNTLLTFENVELDVFKMIGVGKSYLKNIRLESDLNKKQIGNTVLLMGEEAGNKDASYWNLYRPDSLDHREAKTYHFMDSIGNKYKLDQKFAIYQALFRGALPIGPVDLLLNHLLDYNGYEGFRLGLGAETNSKVLKSFRIGGYGAYGFKDKRLKYGSHLRWLPNSNRQFESKLSYENDITESGGTTLFNNRSNPFSSESFQNLFINRMDRLEKFQFETSFQAFRDFHFTFFGNTQDRQITTAYNLTTSDLGMNKKGQQNFHLTEAGINIRWSFREKFVEMFGVKTPISYQYPILHLKFSRGINGLLDGDFDYNRLDLKVEKNFLLKNLGQSSLRLHAGYIDEVIPLTALYRTNGTFNEKLRLASDFSFQTIAPNEFFNNQYISFFFKHSFKNLLFNSELFKPELAIVSSFGYGKIHSMEKHQNQSFKDLRKGLFESGVQIDRLLGFANAGVGAYYRYGPYSRKSFEDNVTLKVTYTFSF